MSTIVIYGASDDLIEVDGAVQLEGNGWGAKDEPVTIDGVTVATVTWTDDLEDGRWRVTPNVQMLKELGVEWAHSSATGEDTDDRVMEIEGRRVRIPGYTDYLTVNGSFRSVEAGGDSGTVKA